MKQSIGLVILQFLGIALGLVSVFLVAGSIPADVYAIVGIYQVISSFITVFSNTGLETHAIRNVLAWKETQEDEKIKALITQAIGMRTLIASLVFLPTIGYAFYMSAVKFNGHYLTLFILMGFFSIFAAIRDAATLILRAFNKYFSAALLSYSIGVFGSLLALLLFIKFGFSVYIGTILLLPLIVTLPVLYMIRKWIKIKYLFDRSLFAGHLNVSKPFAISAYISYLFNFLDQFIVSIFLSPEIIGSFTIGKKIVSIAKTFVENIFDPAIQNLVKFRNKADVLKDKLNKIFRVRNILLSFSLLVLPLFAIFLDEGIVFMRLGHYPFLKYFLIAVYISQIIHVGMKVKYNFISLFYSPNIYFNLTIVNAILSIVFLLFIVLWEIKFVFYYIALTNLFMILYTRYIYRRNNGAAYPGLQARSL